VEEEDFADDGIAFGGGRWEYHVVGFCLFYAIWMYFRY